MFSPVSVCLDGWLVGWFDVWLVGWWVDWLVGWVLITTENV